MNFWSLVSNSYLISLIALLKFMFAGGNSLQEYKKYKKLKLNEWMKSFPLFTIYSTPVTSCPSQS